VVYRWENAGAFHESFSQYQRLMAIADSAGLRTDSQHHLMPEFQTKSPEEKEQEAASAKGYKEYR